MRFKEIGTIGSGNVLIKAGVVGLRRVISLSDTRTGEHILSMNPRAAMELITHLRTALREVERVGEEEVERVKPK